MIRTLKEDDSSAVTPSPCPLPAKSTLCMWVTHSPFCKGEFISLIHAALRIHIAGHSGSSQQDVLPKVQISAQDFQKKKHPEVFTCSKQVIETKEATLLYFSLKIKPAKLPA